MLFKKKSYDHIKNLFKIQKAMKNSLQNLKILEEVVLLYW